MLADKANDLFHFLSILESIGKIQNYLTTIHSPEDFIEKEDQLYFNASLPLLANIGETFGKLSDESKHHFNSEDIKGLKAIRNRIVHDYTGIDSFIIYDIIQNNIPDIQACIYSLLRSYIGNGIVDKQEFELAKSSEYYKHIDFNEF